MRKFWTQSEIDALKASYSDALATDLLELLPGRSISSIHGKAFGLGLRKSEDFHLSGKGGRLIAGTDRGAESRFKPNMTGWNKGLKQSSYMSAESIENTKKTRFKKGQDPHNSVPIGTERLSKNGYIEVKVAHLKDGTGNNRNFKFKHRLVYEANFGPIPKGKIVVFLDGNIRNFEPENLGLRSRKEHMLSNGYGDKSVVKRFMKIKDPDLVKEIIENHPEIINLQRKIITVKSKLNGRNREVNSTTRR